MARTVLVFVVLYALCAVAITKHVHPRSIVHVADQSETENDDPIVKDIDGMTFEVIRKIKPNRFVPVNNVLFFTNYPPCEEGFERDLLGVCREVWD